MPPPLLLLPVLPGERSPSGTGAGATPSVGTTENRAAWACSPALFKACAT